MVLADELEADWNRVTIVQAQGDPKYGDQYLTYGSRSTSRYARPAPRLIKYSRRMQRVSGASTRPTAGRAIT
jgi:isoquinoline 1-oxidoreductase subunit beta